MLDNLKATDFNPKIEFKMLSFLDLGPLSSFYYNELKAMYNAKKEPALTGEMNFYHSFCVYQKLKESKEISINVLCECAEIYKTSFKKQKLESFLSWYKEIENLDLEKRIPKTIKYIIKERIFSNKSSSMAILITNSLLAKAGYMPIIYKKAAITFLIEEIESGINDEFLENVLDMFSSLPKAFNTKYDPVDKAGIISLLKANKEKIYSLGIKKLWLFGSFVKNLETEYSDVDLYALTTEDVKDAKPYLIEEIGEIVKRPVDLHINEEKEVMNRDIFKETELILDADK